ncbi:two-component system, OmpR family, sensor histidine kinase ResE [Seinonella peptonophila]|uniref:histidine kinase n=1 Tax=Seinonella peptonophila TaxID=112248 RepID=A0A1M4TI93_9BACL|nr:ATP-binding protein [Seinonella peptonophila]SHE44138.1 two-component system, OmpR family, sensor histidine kinase ResE [Seinonella peptonophila]
MIIRSIVGKLWLTIIVLVALVLSFFSLFLNMQVDKSYTLDHEKSLKQLATEMRTTLEHTSPKEQADYIKTMFQVSELFHTYVLILNRQGKIETSAAPSNHMNVALQKALMDQDQLKQIFRGETVVLNKKILLKNLNQLEPSWLAHNDVLMVATPYYHGKQLVGAIVLYQAQDQLSENDIKWWIFYSASIGIILTTVFAFFLSSRITQPLIQLKQAAEQMAKGKFSVRLPVRIHERDEIVDVSIAFNRMAGHLEDSIQMLSHEKEKISSVLQSMSDGVISLDAEGKVILTNPPAERLLELFNQTQRKEDQRYLPQPLDDLYQQVVAGSTQQRGDMEIQGNIFSVVMSPLYEREQVRGVVAVIRDVTEARRLNKLRKDFVTNVSHELRTPLAMLQGYSEALKDDVAETPEERREIALVINEESERMGRLVSELLDLASMEAGHISIDLQLVDIRELFVRMTRKFQSLAKEQGIILEQRLPEVIPEVRWDEDKIEQVLTNLLGNAIRHTPKDGHVNLSLLYEIGQNNVQLNVSDTGVGIPVEDIPFIFERFYKADKARTRNESGGTGLGLSIAKHLVTAHGGDIHVSSQLGKGTSFSVILPLEAKQQNSSS